MMAIRGCSACSRVRLRPSFLTAAFSLCHILCGLKAHKAMLPQRPEKRYLIIAFRTITQFPLRP